MKNLMLKTTCLLILSLATNSCTLTKIDKASAPPEDYWIKSGYSKGMVRTFLYENCKYLMRPTLKEFSTKLEFEEAYKMTLIKIENCMLGNGFNFSLDGPATPGTSIWVNRCNNLPFSEFPSCLSLNYNKEKLPDTFNKPSKFNSHITPYTNIDNDYDFSTELRNKNQEISNRQMNNLLRNTAPHH